MSCATLLLLMPACTKSRLLITFYTDIFTSLPLYCCIVANLVVGEVTSNVNCPPGKPSCFSPKCPVDLFLLARNKKERRLTPSRTLLRCSQLDTGNFLWDRTSQGHVAAEVGHRGLISCSPPPTSHQHNDSVALGGALVALLKEARSGASLSDVNRGGSRAAAGDHGATGLGAAAEGRQKSCDIVVVHGCEPLDNELLPPDKFGLGPAEAVSVFIDLVPQVRPSEFGLGEAASFVSGLA